MWLSLSPHPTSTLKCLCWYPLSGSNCNVTSRILPSHANERKRLFLPIRSVTVLLGYPQLLWVTPINPISVICSVWDQEGITDWVPLCPALGCRHMHELHLISAPNTVCDISQIINQSIQSYFLTDWIKTSCHKPTSEHRQQHLYREVKANSKRLSTSLEFTQPVNGRAGTWHHSLTPCHVASLSFSWCPTILTVQILSSASHGLLVTCFS